MKTYIYFFGRHEGKLETFAKFCVAVSLETLREDPTLCALAALQKSATNRLFGNYSAKSPDRPWEIVMILSDHMHPKPSFTLFCKQIYDLEMIQLDSKLVACFLPTCSLAQQTFCRK